MATYAVLGATGNCGTALIDIILRNKDAKINAFCRNKAKLVQKVPQVKDNEQVQIFQGGINDIPLLTSCIRNTRTIFHVVATNDNIPGCSVGLDTAKSIIQALEGIKADSPPGTKLPKIVLLSSSTLSPKLSTTPRLLHHILVISAYHVYEDLRRTEEFLNAQQDWVTTIFMKPGGLSLDVQRGHKVNLERDETFVSYLDLAAAMVEVADDTEGQYDMKEVSVTNTNGAAKFPSGTPLCILVGVIVYYLPSLRKYLPSGLGP